MSAGQLKALNAVEEGCAEVVVDDKVLDGDVLVVESGVVVLVVVG